MGNENELISASVSDRGLSEKRPQNEDSFAELPEFGVFAVADGVGGAQAGDFASQMAMELLTEAVANRTDLTDAEELFRLAIEHANRSIYQMAADVPQLSTMATTIVALHLKGNIATIAHVGDSRIYRFSPDGEVFRETNDHSVVEEEVRAGRMTPEEAAIHPSRNVISRALGAEPTVDIDFKTIMVEPGTTFLLCSDGITRHIPDDELRTIFSGGAEPRMICDYLKEVCYSRGAEDNLTAVIVRSYAEPAELTDEADAASVSTASAIVDDLEATVSVLEEETIASARSAYAASAGESGDLQMEDTISVIDVDEGPTDFSGSIDETAAADEELPPQIVEQLNETDSDEQYLPAEDSIEPATENAGDTPDAPYVSSSVMVPAQKSDAETDFAIFGSKGADAADHARPSRRGVFRRIFVSLGLLILGGAAAIGTTYYLGLTKLTELPPAPQVETMKTNDIAQSSFEELRRSVDNDPSAYIDKYAPSPRDASDYYLLGRALLLTGKVPEAKRQLELAREQLPQTDDKERKTLSNEIIILLTVIENPQAVESFKRSVAIVNAPTNVNSNTSIR